MAVNIENSGPNWMFNSIRGVVSNSTRSEFGLSTRYCHSWYRIGTQSKVRSQPSLSRGSEYHRKIVKSLEK
jgi:hypothetical protein